MVKRSIKETHSGRKWSFVGGKVENPSSSSPVLEQTLKREIKEELGVSTNVTYIGSFSGSASYKEYDFPIINFAFLTELQGKIKLNTNENTELAWVPLKELNKIAFDSNEKILKKVKEKFSFDLDRVKELTTQLDSTAEINEQSLYKAMLDGYVYQIKEEGKLLGMGWIFPRQTILRSQAVVEDMIVDESQRGKGLGEKILLELIKWAKDQGVEVVELTTNPKRIAANSLYQKVGFKLHETNHYLLKL